MDENDSDVLVIEYDAELPAIEGGEARQRGGAEKLVKYSEDQERVPAGSPEGGEFAGGGATFHTESSGKDSWNVHVNDVHIATITRTSPAPERGTGIIGSKGYNVHFHEEGLKQLYPKMKSEDVPRVRAAQKTREYAETRVHEAVNRLHSKYAEPIVSKKLAKRAPVIIRPGRLAPASILARVAYERVLARRFKTMRRRTVKTLAAELGLDHAHLAKYSEDQPRDEQGRWTEGGVSSSGFDATTGNFIDKEGVLHKPDSFMNITDFKEGALTDKYGYEYRVVHEGRVDPDKKNIVHSYHVEEHGAHRGSTVAGADLKRHGNMVSSVYVQPEYQRRGIASSLYDYIETDLGIKLSPGNWAHTQEGAAFWAARLAQRGVKAAFDPAKLAKYSENQARDEQGRWTEAGGGEAFVKPVGLDEGIPSDSPVKVKIPLSALSISNSAWNQTESDVALGRESKTGGRIRIFYDTHTKQFLVEDGMHRIVQAYQRGETHVQASLWSGYSDYIAGVRSEDRKSFGESQKFAKRRFDSVQFNLSPADAARVLAIEVDEEDWAAKGRDLELHVTVLYGLDGATKEQVESITRGTGEVEAALGALETFPEGDDGVPLVIRVESEALVALHDALTALPHTDTHPEYKPHVCIGYLKPGVADKYVETGNPLEGETIILRDLVFSSRDDVVMSLAKYSDDQEREPAGSPEGGQFAGGGGGPVGETYHGTTVKIADKIVKEGIKTNEGAWGNAPKVWATDSIDTAKSYGEFKTSQWAKQQGISLRQVPKLNYAVVVVKAGYFEEPADPAARELRYLTTEKSIPASAIKEVRIFSMKGKLLETRTRSSGKADETWAYLPVPPEVLFEDATFDDEKLAKASREDAALTAVMNVLASDWESIAAASDEYLAEASLAGASLGGVQLDITSEGMLQAVNETARDWARDRAAELVGMRRLTDGTLVANPSARWAITETTRDSLRNVITDLFESEKANLSDVEAGIEDAGIFSDTRATMIARTEISRAQTQGNLLSWKTSGLVENVGWLLSAMHDKDDECDDAASESPYAIDDVPELPLHPNCECALVLLPALEAK